MGNFQLKKLLFGVSKRPSICFLYGIRNICRGRYVFPSQICPIKALYELISLFLVRIYIRLSVTLIVDEVLFIGNALMKFLHCPYMRFLRMRHTVPLTHGFITYRVRGTMFIVCGIDEFVCDGFDGVVAVADGFGAVVQRQPLVEGRVLSRLKGLTAAGNLARRNSAREVADQTSNIRMAFVLNLPDIDVRVVLSQLQMRQQRPITPNHMLTILAVHPPRFDFPKPELRSQSRLGVLK